MSVNQSKAKRHSWRVKFFKYSILFFGTATMAAVLILPAIKSSHEKKHPALLQAPTSGAVNPASSELTKIENPKFYGKDEKEQPYTITAKVGVEATKGIMELEEVYADLTMQDSTFLKLKSDAAVIATAQHRLDLLGNVNMVSDSGYTIDTPSAIVHYKDKAITGDNSVEVKGKIGVIQAPAFKITNGMEEVIFHGGRVKTTLYNKKNESN